MLHIFSRSMAEQQCAWVDWAELYCSVRSGWKLCGSLHLKRVSLYSLPGYISVTIVLWQPCCNWFC